MSKPVTDSALETAWPGSGLPNTTQSRSAHGAKTSEADGRHDPDHPDPLRARRRPAGATRATPRRAASQTASLRVSAAAPSSRPMSTSSAGPQAGAARVAQDAGHEQAAPSARTPNRHRRVGQGRVEEQRQVDGGREPGPDGERPRPARGQAALRGHVRREPPGEHRARARPASTEIDLRRAHRGLERDRRWRARTARSGSRPGTTAAAARPRTPGAGRRAAACRSSTARPRRARGPRRGCARRRRSRPCPPAWGTRRRRPRRPGRRARSRRSRAPSATASRRSIGRQPADRASRHRRSGRRRARADRVDAPPSPRLEDGGPTQAGRSPSTRIALGGRHRVVPLEDEPADVVGAGDRLDGLERVVDQDDAAAARPVRVPGGVDRHHAVVRRRARARRGPRRPPAPAGRFASQPAWTVSDPQTAARTPNATAPPTKTRLAAPAFQRPAPGGHPATTTPTIPRSART